MSLYGVKELSVERDVCEPDVGRFDLIWKTLKHIAMRTEAQVYVEKVDDLEVTTIENERLLADELSACAPPIVKRLSARLTEGSAGQSIEATIATLPTHEKTAGQSIEHVIAIAKEGQELTEFCHSFDTTPKTEQPMPRDEGEKILRAHIGGEMELRQGDLAFLFHDLMEFSETSRK